jgi:hypothetical protein
MGGAYSLSHGGGGDRTGRLVVGLALVLHAEIVVGGVNNSIHCKGYAQVNPQW